MSESQDFSTVLVKDKRIAGITDSVSYAVKKGGANVTVAKYQALSGTGVANPSSVVFNIQCPSEQVVVDRRVRFESKVTLTITGTQPAGSAVGSRLVDWANRDGLGPFPLHSLFNTMSATINNNTVSQQMQQLLPALANMYDNRVHNRWVSTTPTMADNCADYNDLTNTTANPLGGYDNALDQDLLPRGSFEIISISGNDAYVGPAAEARTVVVVLRLSEYLMLSPFIYQETPHEQGLLGVQVMNFQFNVANASRIYRTSNRCSDGSVASPAKTCASFLLEESQLVFQFLSLHPSDVLSSRNVVPAISLPIYSSSNFASIAAGASADNLTTSTFSLNQIPDKLIIYASKAQSALLNSDPDFALVIRNISIQFNNSQGILSNANQYDLYNMSYCSGSQQSWVQFKGAATRSDTGNAAPVTVRTAGSYLVLDFATAIQLSEDYLAPSSIGQYSLAITLSLYNQSSQAVTPVVNIITVNSSLFVCDRGQSSSFEGILDKKMVLDASQKDSRESWDVERIIGGAMSSTSAAMGMALKDKKMMGMAGPASVGVANGKMQSRYK